MARGKGDFDIRANLSGRGSTPARPATPGPDVDSVEALLDEYANRVRDLDELSLEIIRRTPTLIREAADKIFAAHKDVLALCFTEEADPYYDENCRVQLGDRWSGGGMVIRTGQDVDFAPEDHPAMPVSRRLIAGLSDQALSDMYGRDGHAILITRAGTIAFDMEGDVAYSQPPDDPDREVLLQFCDSAGRY